MERRAPDDAPPSLLIVIDEFATLAKEVPDFVDGIVDVAQRGRSLGVHLLLATQRPGGVVSENIRANTNLRMALRVNEAAESTDVIGVPDAARIPRGRPGRAYARTGHGELDGAADGVRGRRRRPRRRAAVVVRPFRVRERARPSAAGRRDAETDLARLVGACAAAARAAAIEPPPSPWLPPLESVLPLDALPEPDAAATAVVGAGRRAATSAPAPARARPGARGQRPRLRDGRGRQDDVPPHARAGARRADVAGRPPPLRARLRQPRASRAGGVAALRGGDRGRGRGAHRAALLAAAQDARAPEAAVRAGGGLHARRLRRAPKAEPLPRILVLLDGYAGFAAAFERVNLGELVDALPRLVAEGRPLGVHFADLGRPSRGGAQRARRASSRRSSCCGWPTRTSSLRSACRRRPSAARSCRRGAASCRAGPSSRSHGTATSAAAGAALARRYGTAAVPAIEPLATHVARGSLPDPVTPWTGVIGLGDAELEPARVDLADRHFLVTGPTGAVARPRCARSSSRCAQRRPASSCTCSRRAAAR